ncbi:hypothetical protein ACF068_03810 [Streptomyces sp. NPDC016309]|uniref:hypothetical protein n=1 Tax=Streptomyces sp. NPDC016309 TaxID=3364965 RepID=UPI0036F54986
MKQALRTGRRVLLYGALGSWWAISALNQLQKAGPVQRRVDPLQIFIPSWRFFGPHPGMHDTHLLYRDELADGTLTEWREKVIVEERRGHHIVWNPNRRREKVVFDAVEELKIFVRREEPLERLQLTLPYLVLLNYVSKQCDHHADAKRTQFLIALSPGYDETVPPEMFFASDVHSL